MERLEFVIGELKTSLSDLRSETASPALRRFLASAWLRTRSSGLESADRALLDDCEQWLKGGQPLEGADWLSAYNQAARELSSQ